MNVVLESMLTCPHCGFAAQETMPTDACLAMCCYTGMSLWLLDYGAAPAVADQVDHDVPASKGGSNDLHNGVLCNGYANYSRGNRPRTPFLFEGGLPAYNAFVVYGTMPPYFTEHFKRFSSLHYFNAVDRLFGHSSRASLRQHMERVERDPFVVERTKRGVLDHIRWLLR
jgi:hypothetical protein